jgi:hypothetical protein
MARIATFTQDELYRARKLRDANENEKKYRTSLIVLSIAG